ncbi:MAG: sugar transporter, partial [Burkholderiaceae bacterium]|nr:sugar transporter [Burkholderiaceae bacterium]
MHQLRLLFFLITVLSGTFSLNAQIFQPVKWKFSAKPLENNEFEITAAAVIEDTWHVYALVVSDKADAIGPIPTTVKINASSEFELVGKTKDGKYITHFDPNFEMDLNYFEKSATFKQKIKAKTDKP